MMRAAERAQPDSAYRTLLGHTTACAACRAAGRPCLIAARLSRAWRKDRQ